jgi:hypothetical protein
MNQLHQNNRINTLGESSLHSALKDWYALPGDLIEIPVDGHIIDIKRGGLLIEIQYRNFNALKKKLINLLEDYRVHLVHPIAVEKWITKLPRNGNRSLGSRRSPKKGRAEHIFVELVHIANIVTHPNFSLELLMIEQEEIRRNDGKGSWRRRGWSIVDHKLIEVRESITLNSPDAYRNFIPQDMPQPFTNRELSKALAIPLNLAQRMVYCLRKMDNVRVIGKQGRSNLNLLIE